MPWNGGVLVLEEKVIDAAAEKKPQTRRRSDAEAYYVKCREESDRIVREAKERRDLLTADAEMYRNTLSHLCEELHEDHSRLDGLVDRMREELSVSANAVKKRRVLPVLLSTIAIGCSMFSIGLYFGRESRGCSRSRFGGVR